MKSVLMNDNHAILLATIMEAMGKPELLSGFNQENLQQATGNIYTNIYQAGEIILKENDNANHVFVIIRGEAAIFKETQLGELVKIAKLEEKNIIGELSLLLDSSYIKIENIIIKAVNELEAIQFDKKLFNAFFKSVSGFAKALAKNTAEKLNQIVATSFNSIMSKPPDPEVMSMLPMEFILRHKVLPLKIEGNNIEIGFIEDLKSAVLGSIGQFLPGLEIKTKKINNEIFKIATSFYTFFGSKMGRQTDDFSIKKISSSKKDKFNFNLNNLLEQAITEGASDVHLAAGHVPYWRIDGEINPILDKSLDILQPNDVLKILIPILDETCWSEFSESASTDFMYSTPNGSRFRVNMYQDNRGVSAAFRYINSKILTFEQLQLPPVLKNFCEYEKGLVLVTGPTGSGKSTTLAAMIDYVNKTKKAHIITIEDPIEFIHVSQNCLINQKQIKRHTKNYASALKSALREDPDIILVGEIRDLETISMALETATTGHLVFGTLHTSTAIGTMSRVIEMFPQNERSQAKSILADMLIGVVSQTLCKKITKGRIAAIEVLVSCSAISNLIREEKYSQIINYMQTGMNTGNRLLNDELVKHVKERNLDYKEAFGKAIDKEEFQKKAFEKGIKIPIK